jgi:hypothetical protein
VDNSGLVYYIRIPMDEYTQQWFTVCRAVTPEGAAESVRVLLIHALKDTVTIQVETRREISHRALLDKPAQP